MSELDASETPTFGTEALGALLGELELDVRALQDGAQGFEAELRTRFGPLHTRWVWYPGPGLLEVQHGLTFRVPAGRRAAMAETLCRVNAALLGLAFELDWGSGALALRATQAVLDLAPSAEQLRLLTELGPRTAERFTLALQSVAFRDKSFAEAFPELRGQQ